MGSSHLNIPISGMTCAACAARLERVVGRLDGVVDARVNFATATGAITFDPTRAGPDDVVAAVRRAGFDVATLPQDEVLPPPRPEAGWRAAVAVAAATPVVVLGMSHGAWLPPAASTWTQAAFTAVALWAGAPIFLAAGRAAKRADVDMNVLVGAGVGAAIAASLPGWASGHVYLEAAASTTALVLLGRWLEARARDRASDAIRDLLHRAPLQATRVSPTGEEASVDVATLQVGDRVRVRTGQTVPVDGLIRDGHGHLDRALLTGEPLPIGVGVGVTVFAGEPLVDGSVDVAVTATGARTTLARIARTVADAQGGRAPIARTADAVASVFGQGVVLLALLTFLTWWVTGSSASQAMMYAVSVLVVACPCALGLATPLALLVGSGRAATAGVVVRDVAAWEALAGADHVVLDKTGTLTTGKPAICGVTPSGLSQDEALALAVALEADSVHPIAVALRAAWTGAIPQVVDREATVAEGIRGVVDGLPVAIGRSSFLARHGLASMQTHDVQVALGPNRCAALHLTDPLRPDAPTTVQALRDLGFSLSISSGDSQPRVDEVARALGIANAMGGATPQDKVRAVQGLRARGHRVVLVGDGVNDALALTEADVGMAIGGGADLAAEAADMVLPGGNLAALPEAVRRARRTMRVVRRNLALAFGYNALALPIAAGILVPLGGPSLSPMIASALMALSSITVVLSSMYEGGAGPTSEDQRPPLAPRPGAR